MKVVLSFVPPGGGETDFQLEFDLPALPQPGDYIERSPRGCKGASAGDRGLHRPPNVVGSYLPEQRALQLAGQADTGQIGRCIRGM